MKNLIIFILFSSSSLWVECQWSYVGVLSDTCEKKTLSTFTFENVEIGTTPSQGTKYSVYRDGVSILEGGGGLGCCYAEAIKPLSDSILFLVVSNQGIRTCYRIKILDVVKSVERIDGWGYTDILAWNFYNSHSGYVVFNGDNPIIHRISDMNRRDIFTEALDTSNIEIDIIDTLYGESTCPGINELVYRFKKNNTNIDVRIDFSKILTSAQIDYSDYNISLSPNPLSDFLSINVVYPFSIKIINILGKTNRIADLKIGLNYLDLSDLNPGFYLVQFQYKNLRIVKSIIKQ